MIEPNPASDTDANSDDPAPKSIRNTESEQGKRPPKVLILEDEPTLLELISEMLALRGMDVTPTNTVAAARHQLTLATFDLFLTDIVVQGEFSGASLAKEAQEQGQAGRVVVMSGHPKQRALAGQDNTERLRFLKKPFSYDELVQSVSGED